MARRRGLRRFSKRVKAALGARRPQILFSSVDLQDRPTVPGLSPEHLVQRMDKSPVLRDPPVVPAHDLALPDDELVLGVERGSEARVYPISTFWKNHIVNDRVANEPLLVTFCLMCYSGLAFDPVLDGRTLTFDVFGVYQGAFVMNDEQTGTLWAHLTGEALAGALAGRRLPHVPLQMTTLGKWLELHPASLTPDPAVMGPHRPLRPGVFKITEGWEATVSRWDERLAPRTLVLGVLGGGGVRAYVLDADRPGPPLIQDTLAGLPIALLAVPGAWPLAYDRRVLEGVIDLRLEGDRVIDETGSTWTGDGKALDGPRAGTTLAFIPSHMTEWYAWSAYHPDTDIVTT